MRALRIRMVAGGAAQLEKGLTLADLACASLQRRAADHFEKLLSFQMTAANLPAFETQVQFAPGRKFASDFAWPQFRLLVEVQGGIWRRKGGAHSGGVAIERDIEKQQLAVINGWHLFPVTTDQVKKGEALKLIEIALRARGWKR